MTCNCTNGRVPGNDWTQPATPCPECSGKVTDRFAKSCPECAALGIVRACPDCEPNNAAMKVLARVDVRVSDYAEDLPVCSAEHTDSMTAAVTLLREVTHG